MSNSTALPPEAEFAFSPVDNELQLRWMRRLRLVSANGLGTNRRALYFVALTWLPIFIWALIDGRALDPGDGESLLRRWILREPVEDIPVLDAPEIGHVADAGTLFDAIKSMRVVPIGKTAIAKVLILLAIPMVIVAALQVPVAELLMKAIKTVR